MNWRKKIINENFSAMDVSMNIASAKARILRYHLSVYLGRFVKKGSNAY